MTRRFWALTMFPQFYTSFKDIGVIGKCFRGERGPGLEMMTVAISSFAPKGFKGVDDAPYGGGPGVVMRADILKEALIEGVVKAGGYGENFREKLHIICPGPRGSSFTHKRAKELAVLEKDLVFICGRYEGIDERFIDHYIDEHISLGDFVVSGGDLPAMTFIDSLMRFIPGVLGNAEGPEEESFSDGLIEYPHYTRPLSFEGDSVPGVLTSGHHKEIHSYREQEKREMTKKYRPDLWKVYKERRKL